jgi:NAD(P)-dependent dehydrogenase (short-subunit alcohol dehydrogenase family)
VLNFNGRVAIVTGGGGGIGRQIALGLARRGARLVVNDIGTERQPAPNTSAPFTPEARHTAELVAEEIRREGGIATANTQSVASVDGPASIVRTALEAFGQIDVVVNNAGTSGSAAQFTELSADDFRGQFELHALGSAMLAQAAWPHLVVGSRGRIINIVSGAMFGSPATIPYTVAKAALYGLTRALAVVGRSEGLFANAVMVLALTPMVQASADGHREGSVSPVAGDGQDWIMRWLREKCPPELVVPLIGWLAHVDCEVNGELFSAGGGRISRAIFADTPGVVDPAFSIETVRDQFDAIWTDNRYVRLQDVSERLHWAQSLTAQS